MSFVREYFSRGAFCLLMAASPLMAQELQTDVDEPTIIETMTVGSRRVVERSKTDTPAPVDVIPVAEVASKSGHMDVGRLLQFTAPSFNANRQSGSDGSDHVDPASLRGLGPDQVLVLINGKRRHNSSLIYLFGTRGRGNVGTDLNTIPVSAIKRIEILRDGASAQYGSDAIAGVINIVLKDAKGLDTQFAAGQYQEGDGDYGQLGLNYGMELANNGMLNITGEFLTRDRTNRSPEGEPRIIGDAETENSTLFFNLNLPTAIGEGQFYGHGGLSQRDGVAGAWYRGGIGSGDIPSRNSAEMYPNGFVPDIGTDIEDVALTFGYRRTMGSWFMDLSSTYGSNEMRYTISNTMNASIATQNNGISPTSFDAGGFEFNQHTTNLDFSRFYSDFLYGVNVAFGLEHRREGYEIVAGEEGSYADFDGPGNGNAGSQGFPGFQPDDEVDADRHNTAAYVDVEWNLSENFLLATALRGEDYNDFGNTMDGKIAFSYKGSETFLLRGSVSTGFRAPSLHQRYFSSTFTDFIAGVPADVKLSPNNSALAQTLGIPSLKEETSVNSTLGFTWSASDDLKITLDAYSIDIDDRIVLTAGFTADDPDVGHLIEAAGLSEARFFTNAVDTRTRGIDATLNHRSSLWGGTLNTYLALNFNDTDIRGVNPAPGLEGKEEIYFGAREATFVIGGAPDQKASLGLDWATEKLGISTRVHQFGEVLTGTWSQLDDPNAPPQVFDPGASMDLNLSYTFRQGIVWHLGGSNIFDARPTALDANETENGAPWENVQMGINGAFYYTRLSFRR